MVPSMRTTPALVAAVVTFLALVAGMASVPTAQADDQTDQSGDALAARRVPTKFKKIVWPATPAVYGTPTYVNGKIKGKKVKKRVVVLQQQLPSGWQKVDKDKTNGKGRFHLKAKTTWYHKKIKQRVVVQATRKAAGNTSKGRGFTVNPTYAPQGDSGAWTRIAPGYKIQYNPCAPVRWRLNTQYAPDGVKPEVKTALRARRRHRHPLRLRRQDQGHPGLQPHVARQHQHGRRLGRPRARPSGTSTATPSVAAASSRRCTPVRPRASGR